MYVTHLTSYLIASRCCYLALIGVVVFLTKQKPLFFRRKSPPLVSTPWTLERIASGRKLTLCPSMSVRTVGVSCSHVQNKDTESYSCDHVKISSTASTAEVVLRGIQVVLGSLFIRVYHLCVRAPRRQTERPARIVVSCVAFEGLCQKRRYCHDDWTSADSCLKRSLAQDRGAGHACPCCQ